MSQLSTRILLGAALVIAMAACKKDKEQPLEAAPVYSTVSTLAGNGTFGFADGNAATAQFYGPEGAAVDAQGNVYVADNGNERIRKISPAGVVSTFAGSGTSGLANGPASTANFNGPVDVAFDSQGNLYVADLGNHSIRKITAAGTVSTLAGTGTAGFADGPATTAQFYSPNGVAVDAQGVVYVSDYDNNRIRKVMPNGIVSTLAGTGQRGFADGPSASAKLSGPEGLALDGQGNLYVAEFAGQRIRKIALNSGTVSTLAGTGVLGFADGAGGAAQFYGPSGIAVDAHGDVFVADAGNHCIRKVTPAGVVSTLAGTKKDGFADGPVATAEFGSPSGITAGAKGVLYLTEYRDRIRKIAAQ